MAWRAVIEDDGARLWVNLAIAPQLPNAIILSLSEDGFLVEAETSFEIGSEMEVVFADEQTSLAKISWAGPGLLGFLFAKPIPSSLWESVILSQSIQMDAEQAPERRAQDRSLGGRIKRLRQKKGLRQDMIASALGVSSASVSHWEADRSVPKAARLAKMANLFDVPLGELTDISKHPDDLSDISVENLRTQLAARLGVPVEQLRIMVEIGG